MRFEIKGESVFATTGGRDFDPDKPVLIFLHGAGFDQSVWNQQSRYFAHRNHSVLAVDFPGNGRSTGKAPAEIGELADWVPLWVHLWPWNVQYGIQSRFQASV